MSSTVSANKKKRGDDARVLREFRKDLQLQIKASCLGEGFGDIVLELVDYLLVGLPADERDFGLHDSVEAL